MPFFHNANIFTAYEYLETRFDAKTRSFTALLFLFSRGMSCGVVISAPAVVLSVMLGLNVTVDLPADRRCRPRLHDVRRRAGGGLDRRQADVPDRRSACWPRSSRWSSGLPDDVSVGDALQHRRHHRPPADVRLLVSTSPSSTRSGPARSRALFLFLSYFGTDQSQVQRYLTAKSVDEARTSLLMSAYWKIPLQALVLIVGVLMFVFYLFTPPPMLFNPVHDQQVRASARAGGVRRRSSSSSATAIDAAQAAARAAGRGATRRRRGRSAPPARRRSTADDAATSRPSAPRPSALVKEVSGDATYNDVNYVFPTFIVTQLPVGLVGLLMAAIFAAAMSTIAGELSALSTATVIDFYRRWVRDDGDEAHLLWVSKLATLFWGLFASIVAIWAASSGR